MPTKHINEETYVALQQKLVKFCTDEKIYISESKFLKTVIERGLKEIKAEDFVESESLF